MKTTVCGYIYMLAGCTQESFFLLTSPTVTTHTWVVSLTSYRTEPDLWPILPQLCCSQDLVLEKKKIRKYAVVFMCNSHNSHFTSKILITIHKKSSIISKQQLMKGALTCSVPDHKNTSSEFVYSVDGWTIAQGHVKRRPLQKAFTKSTISCTSFWQMSCYFNTLSFESVYQLMESKDSFYWDIFTDGLFTNHKLFRFFSIA